MAKPTCKYEDPYVILGKVGIWAKSNMPNNEYSFGMGVQLIERYERENGGYIESISYLKQEITNCIDLSCPLSK